MGANPVHSLVGGLDMLPIYALAMWVVPCALAAGICFVVLGLLSRLFHGAARRKALIVSGVISPLLGIAIWTAFLITDARTHVSGPFYLMYFETRDQMALFRCPDGPDRGCAIDGLPDATVYAAGADERYIVVARHPHVEADHSFDQSVSEYFYFARINNERRGWGNNPEQIIGPLNDNQFRTAKRKLRLPDFSIVLDDLK